MLTEGSFTQNRKGFLTMNTIKVIPVLFSTLAVLGACSPGHIAANKNGKAEYVWVGCHNVTQNPSTSGAYAISPDPLQDLAIGDKLYFKQVGNDGTVGPVETGEPCKH
jgi:hypothetical protein|tara:strand:- start:371 stop:694 length:324 start_codon:yes stop_codon:yes gene_type:complete